MTLSRVTLGPVLETAVPVSNEEADLEANGAGLRRYLDERFPVPALVTAIDYASTDCTWERAPAVQSRLPGSGPCISTARVGTGP